MLEYSSSKLIITVSILLVYFLVMFATAFFYKGAKMTTVSVEEYAVGNRSFSWVLVMFTYVGTFTSSTLYTEWFSWAGYEGYFPMYIVVYSAICYIFVYMMSKKAYVWGKEYKCCTMPDFVQARYNNKRFTKVFAVIALALEVPWAIMEFYAMGSLVEAVTYGHIGHSLATIIIVAFVASYILYSGMKSIAWTELLQGILTSIVIGVFFVIMVFKLYGGFGPMWQQIAQLFPENMSITYGGAYEINYWTSVVLLACFGNLCQISYFTRLFTAKSPLNLKKCAFIGAIVTFFVCAMQFTMASGLMLIPGTEEVMANQLASFAIAEYTFGPWFMGLMAVTVIAAGMSLVATVMSSHSVVIAETFLKNLKKFQTDAERVKLIRIIVIIYTVICLIVALMNIPALHIIALFLFEGLIQCSALMLFGVFWKRANLKGAATGFILGLTVTYLIYLFAGNSVMGYSGGIIGVLVNCACNIIFGLMSPVDERTEYLFKIADEYIDTEAIEAVEAVEAEKAAAAK
ncbi:MAG: sodium:solute symporter family protein [Bacillota bacterium]|jgi:SSS family solute:Na+ symporter